MNFKLILSLFLFVASILLSVVGLIDVSTCLICLCLISPTFATEIDKLNKKQ